MTRPSIFPALAAGMLLISGGAVTHAAEGRVNSIDRFGLGGYIQPVGIHHGFHIESVAEDSAAARDHLKVHDVIVKIDGEAIRSLDHLRAALAEAYADDGAVTITYLRGASLQHRELKTNVKLESLTPVGNKRKIGSEEAGR